MSHSHAARSLQDSSVYPDDDSDTGSEDESASVTHPLEAEVREEEAYTVVKLHVHV